MRRPALWGALTLGGLVAATGLAWTFDAPPASAEPECLSESNDFDRDGSADVTVGMPGAKSGAGAVEVRITNGGDGKRYRLEAPAAKAGDGFGSAIAEVAYYQDEGDDARCSQLVVGAPGRDVAGKTDAGSVFLYEYSVTTDTFALVREFTQGSNGVPGAVQAGAKFGSTLASRWHWQDIGPIVTQLYVGAPGTTVGGASGAGAFARLTFGGPAGDVQGQNGVLVTQDSPNVPGGAEQGDQFGASLAVAGYSVFAGSPGENSGAGGFVQWTDNPDHGQHIFVTQNTEGVPGTSEAGDRFGATLYAAHEAELAGGGYNVLAGAPGEAIGTLKGAGSVLVFAFNEVLDLAQTKGFNQDTAGVAGGAEAGDAFGSALGTWGKADFLVGSPGEDLGSAANAGAVYALRGDRSWTQDTTGVPGAVEAGDRFGGSISNARVPFGGANELWLGNTLIGLPGENAGAGAVLAGLPAEGSTPTGWTQQSPVAGDRYGTAIGGTF